MKKRTAKKRKMTLEKLAAMVQRGFEGVFETMTTKKELQVLREEIDSRFLAMDNKVDALYIEIKDIKSAIPPLIRAMSHYETPLSFFNHY